MHCLLQRPVEVFFVWLGIHSTKVAKEIWVLIGFFSPKNLEKKLMHVEISADKKANLSTLLCLRRQNRHQTKGKNL